VAEACALHQANDLNRWHLEARVLTAQPVEEVARHCALQPAVVEVYTAIYFDVTSRLAACDWLAHRVLPRRCSVLGINPTDTGGLLKVMALTGGPLALDRAIRVITRPRAGQHLEKPDMGAAAEAAIDLACRFSMLLHTLPVAAFRTPLLGALEYVSEALGELQHAIESACRPGPLDVVRDELRGTLLGCSYAPQGAAPEVLPGLAARMAQLEGLVDRFATFSIARAS
jgi:hypothetical protein